MNYSFYHYQSSTLRAIIAPGDPQDPMIIFLHGYGGNGDSLTFFPSICSFKTMRPTWIFPQGIERLEEGVDGRAWFPLDINLFNTLISNPHITPDTEHQYQMLFNVDFDKPQQALEGLIEELGRPRHEIILGGFSQGAMMVTHLSLSSKVPFQGALICSGALLFNKGWEDKISFCGRVPYLQSHGHQDAILPYYLGEQLHSLLSSRLKGEFVSFHGGHEIPTTFIQKMQTVLPQWRDER